MSKAESAIWSCAVCIEQFFGGPRCPEHNPVPEPRGYPVRADVSRQTPADDEVAF